MSEKGKVTGSGGCLCGSVRFETYGKLRDVAVCHCDMCQIFHGSAISYTSCKYDELAFLKDDTLEWYRSSDAAKRGFCSRCGSSMFFASGEHKDSLGITAGCLDKPTGLKTKLHIHVASKPDFYDINDDLPKLDEE